MGWVALGLIGLLVVGALWALGVARPLWTFVGAGLMLGATGYAVQGRPGLPGHPVEAFTRPIAVDQTMIELRGDMLGRYTGDVAYLIAADALTRSGNPRAAVQVILGGIRHVPNSLALWTWLGMAYATHDGGAVSPASRFAFDQAMRINSKHPAPPFFLGLALIQSGDFAAARPYWARALALTPKGISYRPLIAERLVVLDQYLAAVRR